jgi:hypothetical protein
MEILELKSNKRLHRLSRWDTTEERINEFLNRSIEAINRLHKGKTVENYKKILICGEI